jgi:hypothetical protein
LFLTNNTEKNNFLQFKGIAQNKIRTAQTQKGYFSMCKLSKIWAHQKLLPSQTDMRQMGRLPLDKPMLLKRKIE